MNPRKRKFAENALKRGAYAWPPRYEAKVKARVARGKYKCEKCQGIFKDKEIQLDHINPIIDPTTGPGTLDTYADRLLADHGGYQALCKACHLKKSIEENELRREVKKSVDKSDQEE